MIARSAVLSCRSCPWQISASFREVFIDGTGIMSRVSGKRLIDDVNAMPSQLLFLVLHSALDSRLHF